MVISTKWKLNYHCSQNKKNRRQPILHRRPNHPQTQKIAALKAHKKGLMQQLFPTVDDDCMDAGGRTSQDAKA
jgi:hypothetical protein